MSKEKQKIVPALRFPEFEKDSEWIKGVVSQLIKIIDGDRGVNYPKQNDFSDDGYCIFLNAKNVTKQGFNFDELMFVTKEKDEILRNGKLKKNDIILTTRGSVGYFAYYSNDVPYKHLRINSGMVILRINNDKIQPDFFYRYCYSNVVKSKIKKLAFGNAQKQLTVSIINNLPLFYPKNKKEQQKIANCLSSLDNLITAETEKLKVLKDHKKGLLQQLFPAEGETQPKFRFPEFKNDGEWEEATLGEISDITTGTSNRQDSTKEEGEYTFFDRSQDIRTSNRFLFDSEAIIVAGEGQEFKPKYFVGKFDLHQRAYAILNFKDNNIGKFLYYLIYKNRSYFFRYAVGSTVKSLRIPIFEKMPVLLPKKSKEQQKIANCLSVVDDVIEKQTLTIKQLQDHKKGLMQQLFPNNL